MERKLSQLFDWQKFQNCARLASIISGVESSYTGVLTDDDLELVSAAGTSGIPTVNVNVLLARHDTSDDEEQRSW